MPPLQDIFDALQASAADFAALLTQYQSAITLEIANRDAQLKTLTEANESLKQQIEDLTRPRVRTPVVSVRELKDTAQLTITLDAAPSAAKDKIGREMILLAKRLGFNAVRYMRNFQELDADLKLLPDNPRNLPAITKGQGLLWFVDSLDAVVNKLTDAQLKTYCQNAEKAGGIALYWNDADRASIAGIIGDMVKRVRQYSSLPQIGSLSATANLDKWNAVFDHVEIQTFGTFGEFQKYVLSPADVLCIDGQSTISLGYLDSLTAMPQLAKRSNLAVYTAYDVNTRWTEASPIAQRYAAFMKLWSAAA